MMEVIIIFNLIKKIKNKICEFCHVHGGYIVAQLSRQKSKIFIMN